MRGEFVRCADCAHAGEMKTADGIAARCEILGIGRVRNAKRRCDHFRAKERPGGGNGRPSRR